MSLWGFSFGMGAMVSTGVHLSAADGRNPPGGGALVVVCVHGCAARKVENDGWFGS